MTDWLGVHALACSAWCLLGLWLRWSTMRALRHNRSISASSSVISAPPPQSLRAAWVAAFARPWAAFHRKTDRIWATGYVCYHLAIMLVVTGYVVSFSCIGLRLLHGHSMPDYFGQTPGLTNASFGNLLTWVFGNAETSASTWLFGRFAPAFRAMAWLELPLALFGNACLLAVVVNGRVGAIRRGVDSVSIGVRHAGRFSGQHLLVRLVILSIIALEFIGRFDGCKQAAYCHTLVAFSLIALVPVTYLSHIPLAPVVIWQALSRRRLNRVV